MPGLMDSINQQLQTPGQVTPTDSTQQAQGLLRAKLGKAEPAGAGAAPQQSNIGEQMANQTTRLGMQQQANQGKVGAEQLQQSEQDIQQRSQEQQAQTSQQFKDASTKFDQQATDILNNLEANKSTMSVQRQQAAMEQAGFMIRGQNSNYVQELQRQGQLNRLQDETSFKTQLQQAVFSDQTDLLKNQLGFQQMMDSSDRQFNEALQNMSDDFAIKMANRSMQTQAAQARVSGIAGIAGAGTQVATSKYKEDKTSGTSETKTTADTDTPDLDEEFV